MLKASTAGRLTFETEVRYLQDGYDVVIGVDEAGRGPLAGPVVAAAFAILLSPVRSTLGSKAVPKKGSPSSGSLRKESPKKGSLDNGSPKKLPPSEKSPTKSESVDARVATNANASVAKSLCSRRVDTIPAAPASASGLGNESRSESRSESKTPSAGVRPASSILARCKCVGVGVGVGVREGTHTAHTHTAHTGGVANQSSRPSTNVAALHAAAVKRAAAEAAAANAAAALRKSLGRSPNRLSSLLAPRRHSAANDGGLLLRHKQARPFPPERRSLIAQSLQQFPWQVVTDSKLLNEDTRAKIFDHFTRNAQSRPQPCLPALPQALSECTSQSNPEPSNKGEEKAALGVEGGAGAGDGVAAPLGSAGAAVHKGLTFMFEHQLGDVEEIDRTDILATTLRCMEDCVFALVKRVQDRWGLERCKMVKVLIDGNRCPERLQREQNRFSVGRNFLTNWAKQPQSKPAQPALEQASEPQAGQADKENVLESTKGNFERPANNEGAVEVLVSQGKERESSVPTVDNIPVEVKAAQARQAYTPPFRQELRPETRVSSTTIVQGDSKVLSIAAASIVAKVTRDRLMADAAAKFPHFENWLQDKGYPTRRHKDLLRQIGPCPFHRLSFSPCYELLANKVFAIPRGRDFDAIPNKKKNAKSAIAHKAGLADKDRDRGRTSTAPKTLCNNAESETENEFEAEEGAEAKADAGTEAETAVGGQGQGQGQGQSGIGSKADLGGGSHNKVRTAKDREKLTGPRREAGLRDASKRDGTGTCANGAGDSESRISLKAECQPKKAKTKSKPKGRKSGMRNVEGERSQEKVCVPRQSQRKSLQKSSSGGSAQSNAPLKANPKTALKKENSREDENINININKQLPDKASRQRPSVKRKSCQPTDAMEIRQRRRLSTSSACDLILNETSAAVPAFAAKAA